MLKRAQFVAAITIALFIVMFHGVAFASGADTPEPNALQRVVDIAFDFLAVVVMGLASYVALVAGRWFTKKTGIEIPAKQEERINAWIRDGILWAEEKSRSTVKEKSRKLTGPDKLELAGKFVLDMAEAQGWSNWPKERIHAKIESWLGNARANGGKPRLDHEDHPDLPTNE